MKAPITATWKINPDVLKVCLENNGRGVFSPTALTTTEDAEFNRGSLRRRYEGYGKSPTPEGSYGYGWIYGGQGGAGYAASGLATVDRINYITSAVESTGKTLTGYRYWSAASGNAVKGWIYGGQTSEGRSGTCETITYDTSVVVNTNTQLPTSRQRHAAAGNVVKGWIYGGDTWKGKSSTIDCIDYSTSLIISTGQVLLANRLWFSASGNFYNGWVYGGDGDTTTLNNIERVDYTTCVIVQDGILSRTRRETSASGDTSNGWVYSGAAWANGTYLSSVDRHVYSTSITMVAGVTRVRCVASSSGNAAGGWVYGGTDGATTVAQSIDRYDYATALYVTRGALTTRRWFSAASGDSTPGEQAA